jgi:hypothetical protein
MAIIISILMSLGLISTPNHSSNFSANPNLTQHHSSADYARDTFEWDGNH